MCVAEECSNMWTMFSVRCPGFINRYSNIIYVPGEAVESSTQYVEDYPLRNFQDLGILLLSVRSYPTVPHLTAQILIK